MCTVLYLFIQPRLFEPDLDEHCKCDAPSVDKGGALDVSGQRELCALTFSTVLLLIISCCTLLYLIIVLAEKEYLLITVFVGSTL